MALDRSQIARSRTASEFLALVVAQYRERPLSYAELGRLCGLRSRSHPREIVLGIKKPSLETAQQISRGLRLPLDLREHLHLLVEHGLAASPGARSRLETELARSRRQLLKRAASRSRESADFFSLSEASLVYASLGGPDSGTTAAMIGKKTGIPRGRLEAILKRLCGVGFTREEGGRYFATERHLAFSEIKAGGSFHAFFLHRLKQAESRAALHFPASDELFWEATFSVKAADLSRLKEELRQVLFRFADRSEAADGEAIRSLTVGFFDPR